MVLGRFPPAYGAVRHVLELARFARRQPHEPDFRAFSLFPERTGLFLDIGANSGASALSFRIFNRRSPILSLEPNPAHERSLRLVGFVVRRFEYRLVAAGDRHGEVVLWVPHYRGMPLTGEASLAGDPAERPHWVRTHAAADGERGIADVETLPITVPMVRIDDLGLRPDFVKIDVEGAESIVLDGMVDTLRRSRPVLLMEIGRKHEVVEKLRSLGYEPRRYVADSHSLEEYTGGEVQNLVFVPAVDPGGRPG